MSDWLQQILQAASRWSAWEAFAVVLAIAYLLLAVKQQLWCWAAAALSTLIYLLIFFTAGLYMESALQVFYLVMAGYGYYEWRWARGPDTGELAVSVWPARRHLLTVLAVLAASALSGRLLSAYTAAALPYLDSFTTWASIVTTYMVARKILENWIYWFVIDSVSMYLYFSRGLYLTVGLFALYLVIIVFGFRAWAHHYRTRVAPVPVAAQG